MNLLIHADAGARSGFIAAWLTDSLTRVAFDVGRELAPSFQKIHRLETLQDITNFNGVKIRIRPRLETIDLMSLLFLRKNVYSQIANFTRDEYSLVTFTKLVCYAQEIFQWDAELDYSHYDQVVEFRDTYDVKAMDNLYFSINSRRPSDAMIEILEHTNKINRIPIDKNHACSIVKLLLTKEQDLGVSQIHRLWSIVDIYNNVPRDQLYDAVDAATQPANYVGIS